MSFLQSLRQVPSQHAGLMLGMERSYKAGHHISCCKPAGHCLIACVEHSMSISVAVILDFTEQIKPAVYRVNTVISG